MSSFYHWLIDWGLTPFLTISQLYHGGQFTLSYISWFSHTSTPHNKLPKQLAAFPHRLSPLVKMNDACRIDFCLSSERKLAKPGFKLTTLGLTACVATDWATGARLVSLKSLPKNVFSSILNYHFQLYIDYI